MGFVVGVLNFARFYNRKRVVTYSFAVFSAVLLLLSSFSCGICCCNFEFRAFLQPEACRNSRTFVAWSGYTVYMYTLLNIAM